MIGESKRSKAERTFKGVSNPKGYVQVNGIKYWHCTGCHVEVRQGARCSYCGKTKREKK